MPSSRVTSSRGSARGFHLLAVIVSLILGTVAMLSMQNANAATRSAGWLHTSGSKILTSSNQPYVIKATAWFGMETASCAPHGLWQISLDSGLTQIRSWGFNTIRLPFSNECLAATTTSGIDYGLNPALKGKTPLQVMDVVVARAEAHGLSVILDRHRPDSAAQSELWYTAAWPEARWINDWKMLAQRYAKTPTVIGVDLHNEPHGVACWSCGDRARDWAAAATRGGNAVLSVNPKLLVVVEGVEHQGNGAATWWGGGLADAKAHPIRLSAPHHLVYSPHDYPASVFAQPWFSAPGYPANLDAVWNANWGYLAQHGTTPVLLGEFGTRYDTASDRQWLARMVGYLKANKMSFAYWSFNPNSGDTGGLVGDDWVTPQRAKLSALAPILTGGPPAPIPTISPRATNSPTATSTPAKLPSTPAKLPSTPAKLPSATPTVTTTDLRGQWKLSSSWSAGYTAQLRLTAADRDQNGWTVRWRDPQATSIASSWGMSCSVASGVVTCTGADWARSIPVGQTVTVGLQVNSTGAAPTDPELTVS